MTSFQHLSNGFTRIFTQADQVKNYPLTGSTCSDIGRTLLSSGIFYFDLTNPPNSTGLPQIYPDPNVTPPQFPNCQTPANKVNACYAEFPIIVPTGDHLFMVFIGTTQTPAVLIELCKNTLNCQPNFPSETLMMDLGPNTQSPTVGAVLRQSDFQIPGSSLNQDFLTGGIPSGYFGNCSHLSLYAPSQQIVCDFRSNITGKIAQTVIFPQKYSGSLMFPDSLIEGSVKINGNVVLQ